LLNKNSPKYTRYLAYLKSGRWFALRQHLINERGEKCQRCGKEGAVDGHHRTYVRLFKERDEDIELLCRGCHSEHHKKEKRRIAYWKKVKKQKSQTKLR